MALNAQIAISLIAHESSSSDLAREMRVTPATFGLMLTSGTGANQAQVVWSDSGGVQDGFDISYSFGGLSDDRGTVSITAVKVLYVKNSGSLPIYVSPHEWGESPFSSPIELQAGGVIVLASPTAGGWSTAGAGAGIMVVNLNSGMNSGVSVPYEIMLIGEGTVA